MGVPGGPRGFPEGFQVEGDTGSQGRGQGCFHVGNK